MLIFAVNEFDVAEAANGAVVLTVELGSGELTATLVTATLALAVRVRAPSSPVITIVKGPWLLVADVIKVAVAVAAVVPLRVTEAGVMLQVELAGPPLHPNDTLPLNPFTEAKVSA